MSRLASNVGVRLIIIAVVAVGAIVLRDRLSGAAAELAVGDCFDQPSAAVQEVESVQHHPCSEAHTGEVFYKFSHTAGSDSAFPSDQEWEEAVFPVCGQQFASYTGSAATPTGELTYSMYLPTEDGWRSGDREVICFLYRSDDGPMTQSHRAASR